MQDKLTKNILKMGIRQKVLLILMLILLTSISISGWFALEEEKKNIFQEINQRGTDISRFVARSMVYSVVGYDYHTIDLLLKEVIKSDDVSYSKVLNLKRKTMAEVGKLISDDPLKMVIFYQDIMLDDEVVGYLVLGLSTSKTMKRLEEQKYSLIKREAFIIFLIVLGEFIALSFIIIKPVSTISKALHEHEEGGGATIGIIPITGNDEFGMLAKQFNELSKNLNLANNELKSRVDYADKQLIVTNNILLERSKELVDLNDEFKKLSVTDSLTGLYNRRYFESTLKDEVSLVKRHKDILSLLVIDIDHFKVVNDTYGHMHGDTVIKMIASVMKRRLRETDVLCRIGGEEFVAICRRADKGDAMMIAEGIREEVENEVMHTGKYSIKITVSLGVTTVTKDSTEEDLDSLFKYADIALYHSKETGRNKVSHYNDL